MALVIESVDVQLAVPAGTITVSPSFALLIADWTSTKLGVRALIILAASAWLRLRRIAATSTAQGRLERDRLVVPIIPIKSQDGMPAQKLKEQLTYQQQARPASASGFGPR